MGLAVASRLVDPKDAHKAVAAVFGGVSAAMVLGVPLGAYIAEWSSWRGAFVAAAAVAFIALAFQAVSLPSLPADSAIKSRQLFSFICRIDARKSFLIATLIFGAHFGTYTYVAPLLVRAGFDSSEITFLLLGYGAAGFIANFVAARFISHSLARTALSTFVLLGLVLAFLPSIKHQPTVAIFVLLWGAAWGTGPLCINAVHQSLAGNPPEASSAMFICVVQIAISAGSVVGGLIVDGAGINSTYWAGAACVLLGSLLLIAFQGNMNAGALGKIQAH